MDWKYRQSFRSFPGASIDISYSGVYTTLSGGMLRKSLEADDFMPREDEEGRAVSTHHSGAGNIELERLHVPCAPAREHVMKEIKSAQASAMTSPGLGSFQELLKDALTERDEIGKLLTGAKNELREINDRIVALAGGNNKEALEELAKLRREAAVAGEKLAEYESQLRKSVVVTSIGVPASAEPLFGKMCACFVEMAETSVIWDTVSSRAGRKAAGALTDYSDVERFRVSFFEDEFAAISCRWKVPHLQNYNGGDIFIYPGFLVYHLNNREFSVIELSDFRVELSEIRFVEDQTVPENTETQFVVRETKADSHSDDDRMPVCRYASVRFTSPGGLNEAYLVSNFKAAEKFHSSLCELIGNVK